MVNRIYRNPWIPERKHPETGESGPSDKQLRFLLLDCLEAFYGGAAGGGKSDALLMGAAMYLDIPGYNAILFRRTLEEHKQPEGLVPRSIEWWGGCAKWNGADYRWTFPSGATVSFGYMRQVEDQYRYQSSAYQYIGFDELSHFEEHQYRYMFSRLRRLEGVDIPLRMRSASNPGGVGHEWVKRRFNLPNGNPDRPFVPAKLNDNSWLDSTSYIASLSNLDPVTREQLLNGNWEVRPSGGMFKRSWFEHVSAVPLGAVKAVRYWDFAATSPAPGKDPDWTVGALIVVKDGVFYLADIVRDKVTPRIRDTLVQQTAILDHDRPYPVTIFIPLDPGSAGVDVADHYIREVLRGYPVYRDKVTGDKVIRAQPFSSAAEAGNVKILHAPWNDDFLDEVEAFPEVKHDDQVDAVSGAISKFRITGPPGFRTARRPF